jgi:uncharacterized protein (TIGR00255 family)
MRSMTGFGVGEAPLGGGRVEIEIRSVNHRFTDVRVRVPRELPDMVGFLEQVARDRLSRGRHDVTMRVEAASITAPVLDRERARAAYRALCELRDEVSPGSDVPFAVLASLPDLFVSSAEREAKRIREAIGAAFDGATAALDTMRTSEGVALKHDLEQRLMHVRRLAKEIAQRSPEVLESQRKRLRERADRLRAAAEIELDVPRLELEVAIFAERCDVSEELTRLESHSLQFAGLMASDEAIGRRLDFLLQEMAREANTVGAKSPDTTISHAIVEVKAQIERMREQVQNVE